MIRKGKDIIGLKVYSIQNGKYLKDIDDLIYDSADQRIKAVVLNKSGMFSEAKIILFEQIKTIGQDVILIEDELAIKKPSEIPPALEKIAKENTYLTRTKIVSEEGTLLGEITDLFFDTDSGQVTEFEVSQGGLKNLQSGKKRVKVEDIITIGQDATIVKASTAEKLATQEGGIQGTLHTSSTHVRNQYEDFTTPDKQQKRREQLTLTQKRLQDIAEKVKIEAAGTFATLKQKAEDLQNHPRTKETQERVRAHATSAQQAVYQQVNKVRDQAMMKRREDAVGRFVTKNVLLPSDEFLAKKGDMITHSMMNTAETHGIIDQVLNNTSEKPITE